MADGITIYIVEAIDKGRSYEHVVDFLMNTYDVDLKTLQIDMEEVLDFLINYGIISLEKKKDFSISPKERPYSFYKEDPDVLNNMYELSKTYQRPFKIFWELTYRCNHQCRHCYLGSTTINDINQCGTRDDFPTERALELLDEMAEEGVLELVITGGEASLHPAFIKILKKATALRFAVSVLTNGDLLSQESLEALSSLPLNQVRIPLYGDPNIHNAFVRNEGAFERTLKNVMFLKEGGAHVVISSVLTRGSLVSLKNIRQMLDKLGLEHEVSPLIFPTIYGERAPVQERASDQEIMDAYRSLGIKITRHQCVAGISRFRITPFGDVNPCEMLRGISYGNVREKSFREVLKSEQRDRWIKNFEYLIDERSKKCLLCNNRIYCVDCLGLGMLETGNLLTLSKEAC